jgi:hypothetical protein
MKLSTAQKIIRFFSSKARFEKIMEESKQWKFTCSNCGKVSSIWELGGIRYKAAGKPNDRIRCPHCRKNGWQKVYKDD